MKVFEEGWKTYGKMVGAGVQPKKTLLPQKLE
jgi:hypothetical protein